FADVSAMARLALGFLVTQMLGIGLGLGLGLGDDGYDFGDRRGTWRGHPSLARPWRPGRLWGGGRNSAIAQALQRCPGSLLLGFLLRGPMPGTERLGAGEHHRRVLALVAGPRALAVVEGQLAGSLLRHLLAA